MPSTVTRVRLKRKPGDGRLKAIADITLNADFAVRGLRVIEGSRGLFVAMPSRKNADNEYEDIAHPVTAECREMIQKAVLNEYAGKAGAVQAPAPDDEEGLPF